MSTYEYTDICGEKLEVEHRPVTGMVMVSAYARNEADALVQIHVTVNPDDAPALALAILEAAGWNDDGPDRDEYDPANVILTNLRDIVQDLTEEKRRAQKREAEDAKAAAYRLHQFKAQKSHPNPELEADAWKDMDEESKDTWRTEYRAAREFFAREEVIPAKVVEPRVIASATYLGSSHWASKWKDADGCLWEFSPRGWGWRANKDAYLRISDPMSFPWTEVLP